MAAIVCFLQTLRKFFTRKQKRTNFFGSPFLSLWLKKIPFSLPRQYHFVNLSLTWTEALAYCRQTYTDIVTIQDSEELTRLMDTLLSAKHSSDTWIGLYSVIDWWWSDGFIGAGANYSNWEIFFNEPNFIGASQFCVSIGSTGLWWDDYCDINYSVLCYNGNHV
uniref:C-type lectin domain-containing protein n=1 Tax=Xiphophorus couchianus TaxID=32473 RepID=A0A3B5LAR2_9TELE